MHEAHQVPSREDSVTTEMSFDFLMNNFQSNLQYSEQEEVNSKCDLTSLNVESIRLDNQDDNFYNEISNYDNNFETVFGTDDQVNSFSNHYPNGMRRAESTYSQFDENTENTPNSPYEQDVPEPEEFMYSDNEDSYDFMNIDCENSDIDEDEDDFGGGGYGFGSESCSSIPPITNLIPMENNNTQDFSYQNTNMNQIALSDDRKEMFENDPDLKRFILKRKPKDNVKTLNTWNNNESFSSRLAEKRQKLVAKRQTNMKSALISNGNNPQNQTIQSATISSLTSPCLAKDTLTFTEGLNYSDQIMCTDNMNHTVMPQQVRNRHQSLPETNVLHNSTKFYDENGNFVSQGQTFPGFYTSDCRTKPNDSLDIQLLYSSLPNNFNNEFTSIYPTENIPYQRPLSVPLGCQAALDLQEPTSSHPVSLTESSPLLCKLLTQKPSNKAAYTTPKETEVYSKSATGDSILAQDFLPQDSTQNQPSSNSDFVPMTNETPLSDIHPSICLSSPTIFHLFEDSPIISSILATETYYPNTNYSTINFVTSMAQIQNPPSSIESNESTRSKQAEVCTVSQNLPDTCNVSSTTASFPETNQLLDTSIENLNGKLQQENLNACIEEKDPIVKRKLKTAILSRRHAEGKTTLDISFSAPVKCEMSEEEKEKNNKRKTLNKVAAARHRQKKKEKGEEKEKELRALGYRNQILKEKVKELEEEKKMMVTSLAERGIVGIHQLLSSF